MDYMEERLIEFISEKNEREKWIKMFEKRANYEKYQAVETMARCTPRSLDCDETMEFDDDSEASEVPQRKSVFNTIINTCKINQDYKAILNILKSFGQRHRSSDVTILYNFLRNVHEELDMTKLTEEHWKYINEIMTIQLFKKQKVFCPMLIEYIKFLYLQQKPIENHVLNLMKELPRNLSNFEYNNDEFEKVMLQLYITLLPQIDDRNNTLAVQITLAVEKWLHKHPQDTISLHSQESILNAFKKLKDVEKPTHRMMKAFKYLICTQKEDDEMSLLDEVYWDNFKNLNDKTLTKWYLKYKPTVFKSCLEKIGIILKDKNTSLVHTLKKYDHVDIPNIITKLCMNELEKAEPSKRERVIKILVLFMPPQDFVTFFKEYIPSVDKVNMSKDNEDARKRYEIQCALAKHFKFTINLKEGLPDLLKYCRGDVLSSALPSLYSSFCRIPEKDLYFALEELSTKAVSVRKHSIFLSSLILPVDKVLSKYQQIENENHVSVKQHIFLSCYKYSLQNDIPECWPILKSYIAELTEHRKDVLEILTEVQKVPLSFRGPFIEAVWVKFEELRKPEEKFDKNMRNLICNLHKADILLLCQEFCMDIISTKLFNFNSCSMEKPVFDLTCRFLLYGGDTKEKVKFFFQCLKRFKNKFWNDNEQNAGVLKIINKCCFEIFRGILKEEEKNFDRNFPKLFSDAWKKEFTLDETFEEYLFIDFVVIKVSSGSSLDSFAKDLSNIFSDALKNYGCLIIDNFKKFLSTFLKLFFKQENDEIKLLKFLGDMLETNYSLEHCALVVDLLPRNDFSLEEEKEAYKKLLNKLLQKDQIIKIRLYGKLKDSSYY